MILLLIIIPCIAFGADQTCTSGNKTGVASGLIYAGNGVLRAIQITPDSGDGKCD